MNPFQYGNSAHSSIESDWYSKLPADRQLLFETQTQDWEQSFAMLSITLDGAMAARSEGELPQARQQVGCAADLARRLSGSILPTLSALGASRHWRREPAVVPLQPELFHAESGQEAATWNVLLHWPLARKWQFRLKLSMLRSAVEKLTREFCEAAADIADGISVHPQDEWRALETLHEDLNTLLREAFVMLKSFLCAISTEGYRLFQTALGEIKVKCFPPQPGPSPASP